MKILPTPDRRREESRWDHMMRQAWSLMVVKFIVSRARSAVQVKSNTGDETTKIQGNSIDYGSTRYSTVQYVYSIYKSIKCQNKVGMNGTSRPSKLSDP